MCVSNNAIELQAYHLSQSIQQQSIYEPVKIVYSGGRYVDVTEESEKGNAGVDLITKVVLRDKDGNCYEVEPSANGLKFAKGEMTYEEYVKHEKKENRRFITYFSVLTGSFLITGWAFIQYFL